MFVAIFDHFKIKKCIAFLRTYVLNTYLSRANKNFNKNDKLNLIPALLQ